MDIAILIFVLILYAFLLYCLYRIASDRLTQQFKKRINAAERRFLRRISELKLEFENRDETDISHKKREPMKQTNPALPKTLFAKSEERYVEAAAEVVEVNGQPVKKAHAFE